MRQLLTAAFLTVFCAVSNANSQVPDRVMRVGILHPGEMTPDREHYLSVFRDELRSRGWIEGRNLVFDYRSASGKADLLLELAINLASTRPDAIVAVGGAASARAAHLATKTIPIVMVAAGGDPIEAGLIQSIARPGGNITGSVILSPELNAKRLELIKEILPEARRVAVVWNPTLRGTEAQLEQLRSAAPSFGIDLTMYEIRRREEFPQLVEAIQRAKADALLILPDPAVLESYPAETLALAERVGLPTVYPWRSYVTAGGLIAYAPSLPDLFRRTAVSLDRILKGAAPAELPVEQPVSFELTINLATARRIGLEVPPVILARASEVFE